METSVGNGTETTTRTSGNTWGLGGLNPDIEQNNSLDDSRSRRLSGPVVADDVGNFSYKSLPVLEKANRDIVEKMRKEAMQARARGYTRDVSSSLLPSTDESTTTTDLTLGSPTARLQALEAIFTNDLLPQCSKLVDQASLYTGHANLQSEHLRLTDALMSQILMRADEIDTSDDTSAKAHRQILVREVHKTMKEIDDAMKRYSDNRGLSNNEIHLQEPPEKTETDDNDEAAEAFLKRPDGLMTFEADDAAKEAARASLQCAVDAAKVAQSSQQPNSQSQVARGTSVHYKNDLVEHTDAEWEAQKDNFTRLYISENMTLTEAARGMAEDHGFDSSPRQWERRVQKWGLKKYYSSREHRLRQSEAQRSSPFEDSTASPRSPSLDPEENSLQREEIIIRRAESEHRSPLKLLGRSRDLDREEIVIRRTNDDPRGYESPPRETSREREEIIIRREERDSDSDAPRSVYVERTARPTSRERERSRSPRSYWDREEIIIRREERDSHRYAPRSRYVDDFDDRPRPTSHKRESEREPEEIIIRRDERDSDSYTTRPRYDDDYDDRPRPTSHKRESEREPEEIIIRREERDSDRYIPRSWYDDDFDDRRLSTSHERESEREREEIIIRRDESESKPPPRQRSNEREEIIIRRSDRDSVTQRGRREPQLKPEQIIFHGTERDQKPLRRQRSEEREEIITRRDEVDEPYEEPRQRPRYAILRRTDDIEHPPDRPKSKDPKEGMWTEITKDLVVKEAIVKMGYEFEETDEFYYILQHLRYVSCQLLLLALEVET